MDPTRLDFWIAVGLASLCGALIGIERQLRGKPAGIRTSILICLGTMLFVRLGSVTAGSTGDPARVLGQVVTGIGFLGAGVMLAREGLIQGVTSAAGIWMLAAIGAMIALEYNMAAIIVTLLVLIVLVGVFLIENVVLHLRRGDYAKRVEKHGSEDE
ncbi:MAG: MgtC/SapB family protein [Candidatus Krumholzibacteriota bacterium]|nr:MgtC/SapB family protein [Candidatus Krumholzibacteriota bacterium]